MITQLGLYFLLTSSQFNLPPGLLDSICYTESTYNTRAIHLDDGPGGPSLGVCQIKYSTAKWLGFKGTPTQLMNPKTNILYAGKYLAKQLERYDDNAQKAVIAYNYGHAPKNLTNTKYQIKVFKRWQHVQKRSASEMHQ
jgi:soluble lytic murein transglycosylase-like protein